MLAKDTTRPRTEHATVGTDAVVKNEEPKSG